MDPIAATRLIEQALEESFRKAGGPTPRLRPDRPKVIISVFLRDDFCRLSLDLSGRSQHKRGYRLDGHPGPLKETLAAAVLSFAGYDGSQLLFDPMCGSGTLVIEGAFVALDKAPLIHRKKGQFGVEWLRGPWDPKRWRLVQDEARQTRRTQPAQPIIGSDINPDFIDLTRRCALRARVEKHLDLRVNDFFEADPPAESGLLVSNIPYGERVATPDRTLEEFYREIGRTLKQRYQGWTVALLVAEESPHRLIDLPPRQSVSLRNGGVPVCLLIFDPQ